MAACILWLYWVIGAGYWHRGLASGVKLRLKHIVWIFLLPLLWPIFLGCDLLDIVFSQRFWDRTIYTKK